MTQPVSKKSISNESERIWIQNTGYRDRQFCPVLLVLIWCSALFLLISSQCPILAVLSRLSCPSYLGPTVLSWLSCSGSPLWVSCPPARTVNNYGDHLSTLTCPSWPVMVVLSRLSYFSVPVIGVMYWRPVLYFLSWSYLSRPENRK
jgi:hypothetical protein